MAGIRELSDSEILARLHQRGVAMDRRARLVAERDDPEVMAEIAELLDD